MTERTRHRWSATAAMIALAGSVSASTPQVSSWGEDVPVLLEAIAETHPDPYRVHDLAHWEEKAYQLLEALPDLQPHEAVLGFQRLLALAADGHTELVDTPHPSLGGPWLPMIFRRFEDGWFVRTGHRDYAELFEKRIVTIGGIPVEQVAARLAALVPSDNALGALDGIGNLMRHPAALHAAGVTADRMDRIEVVAMGDGGEATAVEVVASGDSWVTPEWSDADVTASTPKPLYRRMDGNYSFEYLAEEALLYVYFDKIRDEEDETIEAFFGRVFDFVEANDVDRFVLDIRENTGGNLDLNLPVLHGILRSKINRPGHLFVIIGRDTYSAAMNLAVLLERHTNVLFAGEPTGATPNHFGDTLEFRLPGSGLVVEISELYWQNSDPRDRRPWITPDLPAPLSSADFFAHRDPALEAIRNFVAPPELATGFGPTVFRWQRDNQAQTEAWPGLPSVGGR